MAQWSDEGNLIRNNSFEVVNYVVWESLCQMVTTNEDDETGNGILNCNFCENPGALQHSYSVEYWDQIEFWTIPDQKHPGWLINSYVGTPDLLTNEYTDALYFGEARTGVAWMGIVPDEALVAELEVPLVQDELYFFEFFVNEKDNEFTFISLYDEKPVHHNGTDGIGKTIEENNKDIVQTIFELDLTPFIGTLNEWTRYRLYFTVQSPKTWISFGKSGMYDDIKLYKAADCRPEWYFDNSVFNYPVEIFQATDFISAGTGVDPEIGQLDGPVTVLNGSSVLFRAGGYIDLQPGFSVEPSGNFEAIIEGCQPLCVPLQYTELNHDCVSAPIQIGNDLYDNSYTDLTWSPSTYLDDPTSENPTFTPPPGQSGTITYTVSYNNSCPLGLSPIPNPLQYTVTINYIDPSLLLIPPTISYSNLIFDDQSISFDLLVNNAVSQVEILAYDSDGQLSYIKDYDRGVDFFSNNMSFTFGNDYEIFWSNCQDYHFVINAKNLCGEQTATVEFDWLKTWNSSSVITVTQPDFVTPNDDDIEDSYCFEHFGADYYELNIYYEDIGGCNSNPVYEETGLITDQPYFCTSFDGHADNGNLLNEDYYCAQLSLFNYCGAELIIETDLFQLLYLGHKSAELDGNSNESSKEKQLLASVTTNNSSVQVTTSIEEPLKIILTDYLGKIILEGTFSNSFYADLPSGIYNVFILSDSGLTLRKKIVVV